MRELRLAVRRLLRAPGFTVAALLTLALAIGANALVYSAVRGMLIRPLPFRDADRLVWVFARDRAPGGARGELSAAEAQSIVRRATALDAFAVFGDRGFVHSNRGRPTQWRGLWVTPSLFELLGVTPALGRALTREDAREGGQVLVLGYERWQSDFAGDSTVIGRAVRLGDQRYTVVGVLPRGLEFPLGRPPQSGHGTGFTAGVQDFWIPVSEEPAEYSGGAMLARLRPGATLAAARVEAETIAHASATPLGGTDAGRSLELVPFREEVLGLTRSALPLLQGFAALVLLIACGNLANLTLARASARERELAIRSALGASPSAAVVGLVAESALLTAAGGALGLLLAWWGREMLRTLASDGVPLVERVVFDGPVLAFTLLACAATAALFGVAPAAVASRSAVQPLLQRSASGHTGAPRHSRLRNGLVVGQVAIALVLLIGAALLVRGLGRLLSVDAGYRAERVIAADVYLHEHPDYQQFHRELRRRLLAVPGVEAVGLIQSTPLTGKWTVRDPFVVAGRPEGAEGAPLVPGSFVAFDYFAAMGIPVLAGRPFTEDEFMAGDAPSIVINRTAARRFFPGESALGKTVMMAGTLRTIVGVVADTRDVRLDAPPEPQWYLPLFFEGSQLVVRTAGDPAPVVESVRRELLASDSRLLVRRVETLDDIVAASVVERRLATRLVAVFAAVALALAAVGLYGVLSFAVARRRRELGLRSALGARGRDLVGMVLRQGLGLATVGVGAGLLVAVPLTRMLRGLLFGVSPTDPLTLATISIALLVVAVAASWVPAWRAARVDPLTALRAD